MSGPRPATPPPVPAAKPKRARLALTESPAQASLRRLKYNARLYLTLATELAQVQR